MILPLLASVVSLAAAFPQGNFYRPMSPRGRLGAATFQSFQQPSFFPGSSAQFRNFHGQRRQMPQMPNFNGYGQSGGGGYLIPGVAPLPVPPAPPGFPAIPNGGQPVPYNQIGGGLQGGPEGFQGPSVGQGGQGRGCPMSPFATFLTNDQQEALHELVTEARNSGADEGSVKGYIDRYLQQVLSPDRLAQFNQANEQFEKQRRGKRHAHFEDKEEPQLVYSRLSDFLASPGLADELTQPQGQPDVRLPRIHIK